VDRASRPHAGLEVKGHRTKTTWPLGTTGPLRTSG
jgi:hypothetical protein